MKYEITDLSTPAYKVGNILVTNKGSVVLCLDNITRDQVYFSGVHMNIECPYFSKGWVVEEIGGLLHGKITLENEL